MPRNEDEDDRPRRRRPRDDEDDDRPARGRPPRDEEESEEGRPRRRRFDDPPPRKKSNVGLILGIVGAVLLVGCVACGVLGYLFFDKVQSVVGDQEATAKNFRKIGLAVHQHHDTLATLPNNSYDPKTGRPLLSWRVHLLPYLGENALYGQFKLNEPWDSVNNLPLVARMPAVYGSPTANVRAGPGKTYYRGFSHVGAVFEKPRGAGPPPRLTLANIPDGTMNTLCLVDAGEPVEWTKPDDIDWSPARPRPLLGGSAPELPFCHVLMLDGSARRMDKTVNETTLRHLIDRQDGNLIPGDWER
jgi:Protein of unknown function (DUF1559)